MYIKKTYKLILFISLMVFSCNRKNSIKEEKTGPAFFPQPKSVMANPTGGYITNFVTGDTIQPIVNSLGDTIKTGIPIPAIGKYIHPDSVSKPKSFPARLGKTEPAHPNVHLNSENLTVIPVNENKLKKIAVTNGKNHFFINSFGDKVLTGVPIPAVGKQIPYSNPKSTSALPLRIKDNSINNMYYLDIDQGLASSYISCMLEDKSGNFWFGTQIDGIIKYDGNSFVQYTQKNGLFDVPYSILEDKAGNIWFGTATGAYKYNGKSFVHFTEKEGLLNNVVNSILEDKAGNIWFGTDGGACKYDGKSFVHFTEKEGLSNNSVTSIVEDASRNIWFTTWGGGVCKYDGNNFIHFTHNDGLLNDNISSIIVDKSGNIWFSSWCNGVSKYDGKSFVHFTEKEGLSNNCVKSILEDASGNIWFTTLNGGASKYDGKSFVHFTKNEGVTSNVIYSILEDKTGNIWFGTWGGGVCKYDRNNFVHLIQNEWLSNHTVFSIAEDKTGNIWFGAWDGGVSKYDGKSIVNYTEKEGLPVNTVFSILKDKVGNLWFGTWNEGVLKYDGKSFVQFTDKEGLSGNIVYSILEDKSGNIWFATDRGLSKYNGKSFVHFTEKEGLPQNQVSSILEDTSGNLWIGGNGVTKYDGKNFVHYTEKEGLSSNGVITISEDKAGNLWFGTWGGGITKYDGKSFVHFTEKEGLSNNIVTSISEGPDGGIWVSTKNGLNLIKRYTTQQSNKLGRKKLVHNSGKDKLNSGKYCIFVFNQEDGLKGQDYPKSKFIDSKNRIWWGGGKAIEMLDLNEFTVSKKTPITKLKTITINAKHFDYMNLGDSLKEDLQFDSVSRFENYPLNLILPYSKNHLTFYFSSIDWNAPHKLKYQYKMEGLDEEWNEVTNEVKADFKNIPYGTYTFKVRAIGESQIWGQTFEYTFTVLPPWWHTWWARIGYGIITILIVFGFVKLRTAKLEKRQKELEIEVDIATKEIREQKDEIEKEKDRSEELLLNILPVEIAEELKSKGSADAKCIDMVTVLFTDFKGFTSLSEQLSPENLVAEINNCFSGFDLIMQKYGIEKIKTIGDAYMAAGGLPTVNQSHPIDVVNAALEIKDFMVKLANEKRTAGELFFEIRIGVHTGPVVAGIVGIKKFAYDIWGDTVNTASRMESSGEVGQVNISGTTFELVKDHFECAHRGKIEAKGKGKIDMYFVEGKI